MFKTFALTAAAAVAFAGPTWAVTLTFDEYEHGDVITEVSLGGGVTATVAAEGNSRNSPDEATIFDTTLDNTEDPDLEGPFTADGVNFDFEAGRALIIQENDGEPDDDGRGGWISFTFSQAVSFLGFDFLDDEFVTVSDNNGNSAVVGTGTGPAFDNYVTASGLLGFSDVTELTFDFGGNSGAIDNLEFEIAAVPVPASLPLMLAGLAGFGFASRRRKNAA